MTGHSDKDTRHLLDRVAELWVAGDDGISSDFRDITDDELWLRYDWVAQLDDSVMQLIRGGALL